jgi:hypothetical protein
MNSPAYRTAAPSSGDRERIEARLGLRLGALLEEQARRTPHDVSERLRIAREQALARARASRAQTAQADAAVGRSGGGAVLGRQPGWLFRFASVLPLVVLVGGLLLIDEWHDRAQIEAAADVDVALLADELPPDAYSDPGFVEFLKQDPQ